MDNNTVIEQLSEDQLRKIEKLEQIQKNIDFKIRQDKQIEERIKKSAVARVDGKALVVKNSYDGTLPQWFTLPANAVDATVSICGGGGGGGGSANRFWGVSGAGGSGGETIWRFPLNNGDTIYSVIGQGGAGGLGNIGATSENGASGGVTIVEGSANFPLGGLRALGGNGGQGSRAYNRANGGGWSGTSNPYSIGGQAGGHGGITNVTSTDFSQDGWSCYGISGGKSGGHRMAIVMEHGGAGGGASMFGKGGDGGSATIVGSNGYGGIHGGGGGGACQGAEINQYYKEVLPKGGKGGNGVVRVEYYV